MRPASPRNAGGPARDAAEGVVSASASEAEIEAKVAAAMEEAAGVKVREEFVFNAPADLNWAPVAQREAAWMRVELPKVMAGLSPTSLPAGCKGFELTFARERVQRRLGRASAGGGTRVHPNIIDTIVDGAHAHIINFGTSEATLILAEHGLQSVPCGNENCCGAGGKWATTPVRFSTKTSAPLILINSDGLSEPMVAACSKCETVCRCCPSLALLPIFRIASERASETGVSDCPHGLLRDAAMSETLQKGESLAPLPPSSPPSPRTPPLMEGLPASHS